MKKAKMNNIGNQAGRNRGMKTKRNEKGTNMQRHEKLNKMKKGKQIEEKTGDQRGENKNTPHTCLVLDFF